MSTIMISPVPALCENAPKCPVDPAQAQNCVCVCEGRGGGGAGGHKARLWGLGGRIMTPCEGHRVASPRGCCPRRRRRRRRDRPPNRGECRTRGRSARLGRCCCGTARPRPRAMALCSMRSARASGTGPGRTRPGQRVLSIESSKRTAPAHGPGHGWSMLYWGWGGGARDVLEGPYTVGGGGYLP